MNGRCGVRLQNGTPAGTECSSTRCPLRASIAGRPARVADPAPNWSRSSRGRRMRLAPASGRASGAGPTARRRWIPRSNACGRRAAASRVRTAAASRCGRWPEPRASASSHLLRTFKRVLGITPREYADACRAGSLKTALRSGNGVADAGFVAGYGSSSRVYERAGAVLGMTPARYAAGAEEKL